MSDLRAGELFEAGVYEALIERAIQECFKWNLGAGDRPTLCRYPLILTQRLWNELGQLAEALAAESESAERELLERPDLYARLGISAKTADALSGSQWSNAPRYTRFDFHPTPHGYRITESNCDVAGGLLEASGVGGILASLLRTTPPLDPAGQFAGAFARRYGPAANIGLAHLAEYSEDRQVVLYLARRFEEHGLKPWLFHPTQLRRGLRIATRSGLQALDAIYRFLPGDWFEQLPVAKGWQELFRSDRVSNPLSTLLTQSKRFPLVWPHLREALPNWTRMLPQTEAPDAVGDATNARVLKPAFGHEGADIAIDGETAPLVTEALWTRARKSPVDWVVQRRFEMLPLQTPEGPRFACVGIFVVEGSRAGGYARVSTTPMIDASAQEAVLLTEDA